MWWMLLAGDAQYVTWAVVKDTRERPLCHCHAWLQQERWYWPLSLLSPPISSLATSPSYNPFSSFFIYPLPTSCCPYLLSFFPSLPTSPFPLSPLSVSHLLYLQPVVKRSVQLEVWSPVLTCYNTYPASSNSDDCNYFCHYTHPLSFLAVTYFTTSTLHMRAWL